MTDTKSTQAVSVTKVASPNNLSPVVGADLKDMDRIVCSCVEGVKADAPVTSTQGFIGGQLVKHEEQVDVRPAYAGEVSGIHTDITCRFEINRTLPDRVRFYPSLALHTGVPLSALVYHIAAWSVYLATMGKQSCKDIKEAYGERYAQEDSLWNFAGAIGVPPQEIHDLLLAAKRLGHLEYRIKGRKARVWLPSETWTGTGFINCCSYSKILASTYGLNASIILDKITRYPAASAKTCIILDKIHWLTQERIRELFLDLCIKKRALMRITSSDSCRIEHDDARLIAGYAVDYPDTEYVPTPKTKAILWER